VGGLETPRTYDVTIEIGGMPIRLRTDDPGYLRTLENRFAGFISPPQSSSLELEIELVPPIQPGPEEQVRVRSRPGQWSIERSDFQAGLQLASRSGWIRQHAHPYATDSILRIVHSVLLAGKGVLLHSASALRNGRAFLFFGPSGAGKSTILRLAPPDAILLSDEISYLCRHGEKYIAHGTPFTGELGRPGDNVRAPIAALYRLIQGNENRIRPLAPADAARALLECVLCFAEDPALIQQIFHFVCELVSRVPVHDLVFLPDARVWELIA
jgi:hypothetical protein